MCLDSCATRIHNVSFEGSNMRPKENKLTMVNLSHNQQDSQLDSVLAQVRFVHQNC